MLFPDDQLMYNYNNALDQLFIVLFQRCMTCRVCFVVCVALLYLSNVKVLPKIPKTSSSEETDIAPNEQQ